MANTRELNHKDAQYVWHPFTQMGVYTKNDNIIIEKGRGSYLYDTEGNKYLDGYRHYGSMCMGISIKS
ncbi:adenosylmethionine-8-amino-7-oxononanoate aminotransferase [Staphylococcus epidermidis]